MDIKVDSTGAVLTLHSDDLPLDELGDREIKRLTEIAFDAPSQTFTVQQYETNLTISTKHPTYRAAVEAEKAWFGRCLDKGINPRSREAVRV